MDRELLLTLIQKYAGGPVGIETLAAAIGEDKGTIEDIYEPFLIQEGYLQRTARGRVAPALPACCGGLGLRGRGGGAPLLRRGRGRSNTLESPNPRAADAPGTRWAPRAQLSPVPVWRCTQIEAVSQR